MKKAFNYIFMSIFFVACSVFSSPIPEKIEYEIIEVNSLEDLKPNKKGNFVYSLDGLELSNLEVQKKKETFITLLLPSIDIVNKKINRDKEIVEILSKKNKLSKKEEAVYNEIFEKYSVENKDVNLLKKRMITYPTPLILAQGALESGWGTSKIFQEANNLFGMHSFNPDEPRIPSHAKNVYLKKYNSIEGSVYDFVLTLSRGDSYKKLREAVREGETPQKISEYLSSYSQIKERYTVEVNEVINSNNLMRYYN